VTDQERADLDQAVEAFRLMTPEDRLRVLEQYATLRYRSIVARFFDAVHTVVKEGKR
jgi:hypothetical protein